MRLLVRGCWLFNRNLPKTNNQGTNNARVASLSLAFGLSACASAQFDPSVISSVKTVRDNNGFQGFTKAPLQPTGFPSPGAKRPDEVVQGQAFQLINADEQERVGRKVVLRGNVEFIARGYHVRADEAEGDLSSQIFSVSGHVLITGNGSNVYGDKVTVDFASGTYIAERAETQLTPEQSSVGLTDKLYVSGKLSSGTQLLTHTQDGLVTTCDLDDPHYKILSRDMEVRTGKRVILRDAKLVIRHRTILQVPFLVIPLDQPENRYTPYVGYTDDEGYFIKNTYALPVNRHGILVTHEDYMTKLGLGLGGDYSYAYPEYTGVARLYHIFGRAKDLTFSNSHRQAFRWGSVQLDDDYKRDDHLTAPGQTLLNTRGAVVYNGFLGARAVDRLTLDRQSNSAPTYSSVSETLGLVDARNIGKLRTDSQISYLDTQSTSGSGGTSTEAQRLQLRFLGTQDAGPGTATIQYQRSVPIGETKQYLGSSDLTPVIAYDSDSRRLFGADFGKEVPLKTQISWGEYADPRRQSQVERTAFSLAYNKSSPGQERLTFDTGASFRQGIYSDDTAQYVLGLNENARYRLGPDTGINLRYGYLRPYGYTPLSLDSTGKTNLVTTDINDRPIRSVLLGLQTGYDINRAEHGSDLIEGGRIGWQQVGIRSEWTPRTGILLRGLYTYDTYQHAFSQLRFDFSSVGREARLNLNAQYDGIRQVWSTFNGTVDGLHIGRTKIAALFQYNGYLQKFDARQYAFTYDLHCAEAVLAIQENDTGFRPGRQIYLLLRLKALPFDLPFGTGTRGQPLGLGNGINF